MTFAVPLAITLAAFVLSWGWGRIVYLRFMRVIGAVAGRPQLAALGLGLLAAGLTAAHAKLVLWPEPSIHDEFAYLLGAETFAAGELTRPTHEFWRHFETMHVLQQPSYAPKYPPGQSLSLALGIVLADEPRVGLWLQIAALVAATTWMLAQWGPRRWAVLGGGIVALIHGIAGPWVQCFYGGALAAIGGALMLGAMPRLLARPSVVHALVLASGVSILAVTRPFEGAVASLPCAIALLVGWARRSDGKRLSYAARVFVPIAVVLGGAAFAIAKHNEAVTGDPLRLPYVEYDSRYSVYPAFLWQDKAPEPAYLHAELKRFMLGFQQGDYHRAGTFGSFFTLVGERLWGLVHGLLGGVLAIGWIASALLCGRRRGSWAKRWPRRSPERGRSLALPWWTTGLVAVACMTTTYFQAHYAAPAFGALVVLLMSGLRSLARWPGKWRSLGRRLVFALGVGATVVPLHRASVEYPGGSRYFGGFRAKVRDQLLADPGRDLVLVKANELNSVHHEFVYNAAHIDDAPIVWARRYGRAVDGEFMRRYPDRNVWRLDVVSVSAGIVHLVPVRRAQ